MNTLHLLFESDFVSEIIETIDYIETLQKKEIFTTETIDLTQVQKYEFYMLEQSKEIVIDTTENVAKIDKLLGNTKLTTYTTNERTARMPDATIKIYFASEETLYFEIHNTSEYYLSFIKYSRSTVQTISYDDKNYGDLLGLLSIIKDETILPSNYG